MKKQFIVSATITEVLAVKVEAENEAEAREIAGKAYYKVLEENDWDDNNQEQSCVHLIGMREEAMLRVADALPNEYTYRDVGSKIKVHGEIQPGVRIETKDLGLKGGVFPNRTKPKPEQKVTR